MQKLIGTTTGSLLAMTLALSSVSDLAASALTLPSLFSDRMVIQRAEAAPVWGRGPAGDEVAVSLATTSAKTTIDPDGRWSVVLNTESLGVGPHELTVATGASTLSVRDVLVGEVWLASGQSNMARVLHPERDPGAFADPSDDRVRFFTVASNASPHAPADDVSGQWSVSDANNRKHFSAVAYFFARKIREELNTPVAIIHASWPGTNIESWIDSTALLKDPLFADDVAARFAEDRSFPERKTAWLAAARAWLSATGREDAPPDAATVNTFAVASADDWETVRFPGQIEGGRVVWLRREIHLPASSGESQLPIRIDTLHGFETAYWDGVEIGGRTPETFGGSGYRRRDTTRAYFVPAELATPGVHILAFRVHAPWGKAGLESHTLVAGEQSLAGEWRVKTERVFPPLPEGLPDAPEVELHAPARLFSMPSSLYNGMIRPLAPYGLRGVLWYQGENDVRLARHYHRWFPMMIAGWRALWGRDDLPFLWCQLPDYGEKTTDPAAESIWSELREAQAAALSLPRTGQAVLIDAGEPGDIHPRDKRVPGARLAALALGLEYGRRSAYSSPRYKSMSVEDDSVRVRFDHVGSGLRAAPLPPLYVHKAAPGIVMRPLKRNRPGSQLEGFSVRGADGVWHWADARIDGDTVVVSAPGVASPVAVRHAWADSPTFNLYNIDGFPAAPFRTDPPQETKP